MKEILIAHLKLLKPQLNRKNPSHVPGQNFTTPQTMLKRSEGWLNLLSGEK